MTLALAPRNLPLPGAEEIETDLSGRLRETRRNLTPAVPALPLAFTLRISPVDVLGWLARCTGSPRVYWASRNGDLEVGGFGKALAVVARDSLPIDTGLSEIERILDLSREDPNLRFVGGRCFDPRSPRDALWSEFPPLWFGIPRVAVSRDKANHYLTVATAIGPDVTEAELLDEVFGTLDGVSLDAAPLAEGSLPGIRSRRDAPEIGVWIDNIERLLTEISAGTVQKVVLARRTDLTLCGEVDPFPFLARLMSVNRNCFAFLFEPHPGKAFVGVTPERLFKVDGRDIVSEAVSGTTGRGGPGPDSPGAENAPLYSEKNLLEHHFVLDDIAEKIGTLCNTLRVPEKRSAFQLSNVTHIYSKVCGRLNEGVTLSRVVSTLHPTPAVGGTPRDRALPLVMELEPFQRGWYAAPVGIIGRSQAEMAVAIRSAIIERDRVALFAGAGIVSGSSPEGEWRELEQKISHAVAGFGGASP